MRSPWQPRISASGPARSRDCCSRPARTSVQRAGCPRSVPGRGWRSSGCAPWSPRCARPRAGVSRRSASRWSRVRSTRPTGDPRVPTVPRSGRFGRCAPGTGSCCSTSCGPGRADPVFAEELLSGLGAAAAVEGAANARDAARLPSGASRQGGTRGAGRAAGGRARHLLTIRSTSGLGHRAGEGGPTAGSGGRGDRPARAAGAALEPGGAGRPGPGGGDPPRPGDDRWTGLLPPVTASGPRRGRSTPG